MPSAARPLPRIEPLEARIAPAVVLLPTIAAGPGDKGASVDLSKLTNPAVYPEFPTADPRHTLVKFTTNVDGDPNTPGVQGDIVIELYDDKRPFTTTNFLDYVRNLNPAGDYDGTIIHRSADFGTTSGAGNDIIQGGGFAYPLLSTKHIPVGLTLHNEFSADLPNVRGTIAMAKVGGDPNSATSEWFFNVNDNTTILGADNNGGFTVFGKVIGDGMNVVDAIAALQTFQLGGFGELPLKSAPATGKAPTADQVVRILDASVIAPSAVSTAGLTYEVTVTKDGTSTPSDAVAASVKGSTLNLKYIAGKQGIADVTVVVKEGATVRAEASFEVDVRPNVLVQLTGDSLPGILVPQDAGKITFRLANNGGASGSGQAKIYLVEQTVTKNSAGQITSYVDAAPGSMIDLASVPYAVASGASKTLAIPVKLPPNPVAASDVYYRVFVETVPADTDPAGQDETFTDDNKSLQTSIHDVTNRFGTVSDPTFGVRSGVVLRYLGKNDLGQEALVSWSLKGPGVGVVEFDAATPPDDLAVTVSGTTLASTLTATFALPGGHFALNTVQVDDAIGTMALGAVDVTGPVLASGGVKSLTLGDLTGQALLQIGAVLSENATKATIKLRKVIDFSLESDMPIASLTADSWFDQSGAKDTIFAPTIGSLKIAGLFNPNVTLSDETATTVVTIGGLLENSTFITAGNLGAVKLGGIYYSNLFAGIDARPDSVDDFTSARSILSFTIVGTKDQRPDLFTNSVVAASAIGTVRVKGVVEGGTGALGDLGFVADTLKSYSRTGGATPGVTRSNLSAPTTFDDLGNYVVKVL